MDTFEEQSLGVFEAFFKRCMGCMGTLHNNLLEPFTTTTNLCSATKGGILEAFG